MCNYLSTPCLKSQVKTCWEQWTTLKSSKKNQKNVNPFSIRNIHRMEILHERFRLHLFRLTEYFPKHQLNLVLLFAMGFYFLSFFLSEIMYTDCIAKTRDHSYTQLNRTELKLIYISQGDWIKKRKKLQFTVNRFHFISLANIRIAQCRINSLSHSTTHIQIYFIK